MFSPLATLWHSLPHWISIVCWYVTKGGFHCFYPVLSHRDSILFLVSFWDSKYTYYELFNIAQIVTYISSFFSLSPLFTPLCISINSIDCSLRILTLSSVVSSLMLSKWGKIFTSVIGFFIRHSSQLKFTIFWPILIFPCSTLTIILYLLFDIADS